MKKEKPNKKTPLLNYFGLPSMDNVQAVRPSSAQVPRARFNGLGVSITLASWNFLLFVEKRHLAKDTLK